MISTEEKTDIRKLNQEQLQEILVAKGEKPFRAQQVYEWLWKKSAGEFAEMTNLSKQTRDWLHRQFVIRKINLNQEQLSADKTIKSSFKLFDGNAIEGVLIPADDRMTACVSSQVGCSLSCKFCATGFLDRKRNLEAGEIYDQVVAIGRQSEQYYQSPLSNIVFMGMGEPLLNYANVLQAIEYITSEQGLGMSSKRITVSTAGIAKMIKKLGDDRVKFNLALSLHAANDQKRNQIMAINETNSLLALREALQYYYQNTKNQITFEYITFHNFNDSIADAEELYNFSKSVPSKINIIEYNPIEQADFQKTTDEKLERFRDYLEKRGVNVKIRRSRGKDIDAACGQLAGKNN